MNPRYLFPSAILSLYFGAAVVYAFKGEWIRVVYWFAAATLTGIVTWGLK